MPSFGDRHRHTLLGYSENRAPKYSAGMSYLTDVSAPPH
jgi:hypothetical protein